MHRLLLRCRLGLLLVGVAVMVTLTSCSNLIVQEQNEVRLYTATADQPGDEALITGLISLTPGGCVGIQIETGKVHATIWAAGTELLDDQPLRISVPERGELTQNDRVQGAGGFYDTSHDGDDIASKCNAEIEVIRIRSVSS